MPSYLLRIGTRGETNVSRSSNAVTPPVYIASQLCEAERTFSALRRMKTWLRATMTQARLDDLMLCHVHKDLLLKLDPKTVASKFIRGDHSEFRKNVRFSVFGNI